MAYSFAIDVRGAIHERSQMWSHVRSVVRPTVLP